MKIKGIKYIAPIFNNSGYAQASRGNILALHSLGVPLTLQPVSFERTNPDLGKEGELLESLVDKSIDYNIVIIHTTPEFWANHKESDKTNVGYTIWETTKLHPDWKNYINDNVEKVLVGCGWNVDIFKNSGVEVPIGVVPHGIDVNEFEGIKPYNISGVSDSTYIFYSIFQFTERKNPVSLIKAYWYAFQNPKEDVALVLKIYRNDYSEKEKNAIRTTVKKLKGVTPMDYHPRIFLILDMLSKEEILGLHARGDCYVSLDRGEGFGLAPFEAGACGNPIIVTGFGGVTEYAKEDNSYLLDYMLTPVHGMPYSPWYRGNQLWAEPSVVHGAELMQFVYKNQDLAEKKAQKLKKDIKKNFSWEVIGKKIIKELEML
jgi:glycosyltransferase involved in cell wall biosynthesis